MSDCAVVIWQLVLYFECISASLQLPSTCHFFQENNVRAFLWSIWMLSGDCMLLYNMFFMLLNGDYLLGNRIDFAPTGSLVHFRHLGNIIYCIALLKIQLNFLLPGYHSSNTLCMRSISPVRPQAIKKAIALQYINTDSFV